MSTKSNASQIDTRYIQSIETSAGYTLYRATHVRDAKGRVRKPRVAKWAIAVGQHGIWLKTQGRPDTLEVHAIPSTTFTLKQALQITALKVTWYSRKLTAKELRNLCKSALAAQNPHDLPTAQKVVKLILRGKLKAAHTVYRHLDTYVREGFPTRLVYEMIHHA